MAFSTLIPNDAAAHSPRARICAPSANCTDQRSSVRGRSIMPADGTTAAHSSRTETSACPAPKAADHQITPSTRELQDRAPSIRYSELSRGAKRSSPRQFFPDCCLLLLALLSGPEVAENIVGRKVGCGGSKPPLPNTSTMEAFTSINEALACLVDRGVRLSNMPRRDHVRLAVHSRARTFC